LFSPGFIYQLRQGVLFLTDSILFFNPNIEISIYLG